MIACHCFLGCLVACFLGYYFSFRLQVSGTEHDLLVSLGFCVNNISIIIIVIVIIIIVIIFIIIIIVINIIFFLYYYRPFLLIVRINSKGCTNGPLK